jgi:acyl carrier protein|tara:strand:+ start:286 stop:543 length:258 start_codon:yes stop_codon:yes gene_type:complete
MDKIELSVQAIMSDVFGVDKELIGIESSQDDIDNWDSLNHLDLIVSLEEEFDIIFPIEDIGNLVSCKLIKVIIEEQLQIGGKIYQ